jgi:type VI secretion system protein ImpJ
MSGYSKVIWSDGLFVKPQHFQQQARHTERLVQRLSTGANPHNFGFTRLSLNDELLTMGRIAIVSASGIMPDGTPFDIPGDARPPAILDLSDSLTANEMVYLCLPLTLDDGPEVGVPANGPASSTRFVTDEVPVRDNTKAPGEVVSVKVARTNPILRLGNEDLSAFSRLAIGRIAETRNDGSIVMDQSVYPVMLSVAAAQPLGRFLGELSEGIDQRAAVIAGRIGKPDQNGVADVSDFLLLQMLNRLGPLVRHYAGLPHLHPREVYELLIQTVGELSTFFTDAKRAPDMPLYNHERPWTCWPSVTQNLRQLITATLVANAVPIPHERKLHGYIIAPLPEQQMLRTSEFVLAVKARVPQERLHREFPAQSKVSSIEGIRELVGKQLPGIPLRLMSVAPRQLPYHAGYSYFALDRTSPHWAQMEHSQGFAFHIAGEFPELELLFWAIRG